MRWIVAWSEKQTDPLLPFLPHPMHVPTKGVCIQVTVESYAANLEAIHMLLHDDNGQPSRNEE